MTDTTARNHRFEAAQATALAVGRPLILDGATGTELDNRGARLAAPIWSGIAPLQSPKLLAQIHEEYVEAGAEVLSTCTFRTTRRIFEKAGISDDTWVRAAREGVRIAKRAVGDNCLTAGSVGPLEDCFVPGNAPSGPSAESEHRVLCEILVEEGVDVLWLETFGTLAELRAVLRAANAASNGRVPIVASVTTDAAGNLISGEALQAAADLATEQGASAFCINCIPISHVRAALSKLKDQCAVPFGVYANLGFAEPTQDWNGSAFLAPDAYAAEAVQWGAALVGACCGSTPSHIRALRSVFGY